MVKLINMDDNKSVGGQEVITSQVIKTSTTEKISIVLQCLESQVIDETQTSFDGVKFKPAFDDMDQGLMKVKIMRLISEL